MKLNIILLLLVSSFCFATCKPQKNKVTHDLSKDPTYTYSQATNGGIGKSYFGRQIAHVMGFEGSEWLERNSRDEEENTALAIEKMQLQKNSVVADIGAGTGYYSFRIAAKVPAGKVYAVDIQDEMLYQLREKKNALKNTIVEVIKGSSKNSNLPDNSVDLAIMVDVYHELEYPQEILQALQKALKPTGKILLIEYRGEDPAIQIKELHKTTIAQLNKEMASNGFKLNYDGEFLPIQHFLLYEKN